MSLKSVVILCRFEGDAVVRVGVVYEYCEEVDCCDGIGDCWGLAEGC
jgi:hypothetical protein